MTELIDLEGTVIMARLFVLAVTLFLIFVSSSFAAPSFGDEHLFRQPDGSTVRVIVWGDEFYRDLESPDGYTLMRDENRWIVYAELSEGKNEYVSTGVRFTNESVAPKGLEKGLRINEASVQEKRHRAMRESGFLELLEEGPRRHPRVQAVPQFFDAPVDDSENGSLAPKQINLAPPEPERVVGLTIIVEFQDEKAIHTRNEVDELFNRRGGIGGNSPAGSVFDYFYDISNGLMEYTNLVPEIITLPRNKSFYDNPDNSGRHVLITDALNILNSKGFDISGVTTETNPQRGIVVQNLNIFYAGETDQGWSEGLWPHAGSYPAGGSAKVNGIGFSKYQMTGMGSNPDLSATLSVVVHENGHMLMGWPDLYHYPSSAESLSFSFTVGRWCVMASLASVSNPQQPNAYFRYLAGWIDAIDITNAAPDAKFTHDFDAHTAYVYRRNDKEAYFIESRRQKGRNAALPGAGLAIWHIHADGRNTELNPNNPFPLVRLMQADGLNDLYTKANSGDITDLFRAGLRTKFSSSSVPAAIWHDGTPAGISISSISDTGATMSFNIGSGNYEDRPHPKYDFWWRVRSYATARENVIVEVDQSFILDMLIALPEPTVPGITLAVRSKNPAAPVTITRGIRGNLFTAAAGRTLIFENIVIDGRGNFDFGDGSGELVRVNSGGRFIMNNGAVLRNNVNSGTGGGVLVNTDGAFTMNGGEISGNTSGGTGGGLGVWGSFIMNNGKISGNTAVTYSGGVFVNTDGTFTMNGGEISGNTSGGSGGGLGLSGAFTMNNGKINGNTAETQGGGVFVSGNGVFYMKNGEITNNTATSSVGGGVSISGTFDMLGGEISGNTAGTDGGGVLLNASGAFTMTKGKISGNTAGGNGGGLRVIGEFVAQEGEISDNIATGNGGAVSVSNDGVFTATNTKINGNKAGAAGGAVMIFAGGAFGMTGGEISGNTAVTNGGGVSVSGEFTMNNGKISANTSEAQGGGLVLSGSGIFTMDGGEITNNTAAGNGGGVRVTSANAAFTMSAGKISNNTSGGHGGGVNTSGSFIMESGEISENRAANISGGVHTAGSASSFTLKSGRITRNRAGSDAGGLRVEGTVVMNGGEISGNFAETDGGGVRVAATNAVFTMNGGQIIANTSPTGNGLRRSSGAVNINGGVIAGIGANIAAVVSGTHNLNLGEAGASNNAVIVAWNKPQGDGYFSYRTGTSADLTASANATAVWQQIDGELGISYANGQNTGFIGIQRIQNLVSIRNAINFDSRFGVFLENSIVSNFAKISVITPEEASVNLRIFDNLGNVVHSAQTQCLRLQSETPCAIIWNLANNAGRFVGNGTYFVVVEARGISGRTYRYSTRLGVRR